MQIEAGTDPFTLFETWYRERDIPASSFPSSLAMDCATLPLSTALLARPVTYRRDVLDSSAPARPLSIALATVGRAHSVPGMRGKMIGALWGKCCE